VCSRLGFRQLWVGGDEGASVSGDDALFGACVLAEGLPESQAGGSSWLGGVPCVWGRRPFQGVRPGMGCPLSVPQWTMGGRLGQPGRLGPWSGGVWWPVLHPSEVLPIAGRPLRRGVEAVSHKGEGLHCLGNGLERGSRIRAR